MIEQFEAVLAIVKPMGIFPSIYNWNGTDYRLICWRRTL